ncbi:MAG: MEDS domain-containing protein, partial [Thermoproteota archaeon]|nr:MEDS domain-containing protein [Thermoproteota archaeon]
EILVRTESKDNEESIERWFDKEVEDGENSILVYPSTQTFRQIYTRYVKDQLVASRKREVEQDNNNNNNSKNTNKQSKSRIILIAPFYETVDSVKHQLGAFGVENVQGLIDGGSLVIADSFHSFFPDPNAMKKLIDSLSERARREGRPGVTAIVDVGFFFLFGGDSKAADLISYEASLAPRTQDGNVKGISCYHWGNYETLTERDKEILTQGQKKKVLEVRETGNYS